MYIAVTLVSHVRINALRYHVQLRIYFLSHTLHLMLNEQFLCFNHKAYIQNS